MVGTCLLPILTPTTTLCALSSYRRRCSGQLPCTLCLSRNRGEACIYNPGPSSKAPQAHEVIAGQDQAYEVSEKEVFHRGYRESQAEDDRLDVYYFASRSAPRRGNAREDEEESEEQEEKEIEAVSVGSGTRPEAAEQVADTEETSTDSDYSLGFEFDDDDEVNDNDGKTVNNDERKRQVENMHHVKTPSTESDQRAAYPLYPPMYQHAMTAVPPPLPPIRSSLYRSLPACAATATTSTIPAVSAHSTQYYGHCYNSPSFCYGASLHGQGQATYYHQEATASTYEDSTLAYRARSYSVNHHPHYPPFPSSSTEGADRGTQYTPQQYSTEHYQTYNRSVPTTSYSYPPSHSMPSFADTYCTSQAMARSTYQQCGDGVSAQSKRASGSNGVNTSQMPVPVVGKASRGETKKGYRKGSRKKEVKASSCKVQSPKSIARGPPPAPPRQDDGRSLEEEGEAAQDGAGDAAPPLENKGGGVEENTTTMTVSAREQQDESTQIDSQPTDKTKAEGEVVVVQAEEEPERLHAECVTASIRAEEGASLEGANRVGSTHVMSTRRRGSSRKMSKAETAERTML
ncbi:hypothetical protein CBS101457_004321 [Exobasidium rhododendri]|nr:hypothetical protein CBS101457_004321 [Exobasidium rhododendri]